MANETTVYVQDAYLDGDGEHAVNVHICSKALGIDTFTAFPVNTNRTPPQVVADIKAGVRQVIIDLGGPTVANADIYLFGGPT